MRVCVCPLPGRCPELPPTSDWARWGEISPTTNRHSAQSSKRHWNSRLSIPQILNAGHSFRLKTHCRPATRTGRSPTYIISLDPDLSLKKGDRVGLLRHS